MLVSWSNLFGGPSGVEFARPIDAVGSRYWSVGIACSGAGGWRFIKVERRLCEPSVHLEEGNAIQGSRVRICVRQKVTCFKRNSFKRRE